MRVVVVSPHRDDAAFSVGLAIEHWLSVGHTVQVVNCFTRSEYAPFSDVDSLHPHDRVSFASAVRRREDLAWSKLLKGKFSIQDLEMMDAPLRLACGVDEVTTIDVRAGDRAVSRVAGAIEKFVKAAAQGDLAIVVPLAVGDHIDHRVVAQAAHGCFREAQVPFAFYEDLPYSARAGLEAGPETKAMASGLDLMGSFAAAPPGDATERAKRKRRFAECYDSQVDSEDVERIAEFSTRYGGRERLWTNPTWRHTSLFNAVDLLHE